MKNQDNRKSTEEDSCNNPASTPETVEPQRSEPPVPDWMFKVVNIKRKDTAVHPNQTKDEQSESTNALVDRIKRSDRWMIFLTALIMVATVGNAIVFWLDSRETSTQINKIIEQVTTLANNTKKSIDVTQENIRLDQRAWVGSTDVTIPSFKANTKEPLGVVLENSGKTPALNVTSVIAFKSFTKDEKFAAIFPSSEIPTRGASVIQPRAQVDLKLPIELTERQIAAFKNGTHILYLYGRVFYRDIFQQPHRTRFCVYLTQDLAAARFCNTHNDAD